MHVGMRRGFALALATTPTTLLVGQRAQSSTVERLTIADTVGDVVTNGKRVSRRDDIDIRSVTLTRTSETLRIVVETVAAIPKGLTVSMWTSPPASLER